MEKINSVSNENLFNAVLHSCILFVVLIIVFDKMIAPEITSIFQRHLLSEISHEAKKNNKNLPHEQKINTQLLINFMPLDQLTQIYSQPDSQYLTYNQWLFASAWIIVGMLTFSLLLMILTMHNLNSQLSLKKFIFLNCTTFILIGAIEFWFFQNIGKKYVHFPPSYFQSTVIKSIKQNL